MKGLKFLLIIVILLIIVNPAKFKEIDEYNNYWVTDSIMDGKGVTIHQGLLIGIRNDREAQFFYGSEGIDGFYSPYGPFLSFINVPNYFISHLFSKLLGLNGTEREIFLWYSSIMLNGLFLIIILYILFHVYERGNREKGYLIILVLVAASLIFYYSQSFYSETLKSLLLLVSLIFLFLRREDSYYFLSGFFYGLAIMTKINAVIFAPCYVLYLLLEERDKNTLIKKTAVFFLPVVFFIMFYLNYNFVRFGNFLDFGYPGVDEFGEPMNVFTLNPFNALFALLVSPGKGIIFYFPVIILYFLNIRKFLHKERNITILSISMFAVSLLFHSFWKHYEAGTCFGNRFMVPSMVIILLNIVKVGDFKKVFCSSGLIKIIFIAVLIFGVFVNLGGSLINFSYYALNIDRQYYTGELDPIVRQDLPEELWRFAGDYNAGFNPFFGMYGFLWENVSELGNIEACGKDFDLDRLYIASFEYDCFGADLDISFVRFYKAGMGLRNIVIIYIYSFINYLGIILAIWAFSLLMDNKLPHKPN